MPKLVPFLIALIMAPAFAMPGAGLKAGDPAPAFSALDQDGNRVSLEDFRGRKPLVLYFYPKDDTSGCTAQACSIRDGHEAILATGAAVLGVSADTRASHKAFSSKFRLPFPLLEDPQLSLIRAYGVKMPALDLATRTTFIIDARGIIRHIISRVDATSHDQQVLAALKSIH